MERKDKTKILDIFCGSGCIGISLLKNIKNCFVCFSDIDQRAIIQTKINLKIYNISFQRFSIVKSNLFDNISGKYDYIFANPPYVDPDRINEVDKDVLKYESRLALFGGKQGLFYIKKFLGKVKKFIKSSGKVYFEFDPFQMVEIEKIFNKHNYFNFQFYKDQFGKYRWAMLFDL